MSLSSIIDVPFSSLLMRLFVSACRTASFLMKHLARMSLEDTKTGMHCKNLAIVWAPNLLKFVFVSFSYFAVIITVTAVHCYFNSCLLVLTLSCLADLKQTCIKVLILCDVNACRMRLYKFDFGIFVFPSSLLVSSALFVQCVKIFTDSNF